MLNPINFTRQYFNFSSHDQHERPHVGKRVNLEREWKCARLLQTITSSRIYFINKATALETVYNKTPMSKWFVSALIHGVRVADFRLLGMRYCSVSDFTLFRFSRRCHGITKSDLDCHYWSTKSRQVSARFGTKMKYSNMSSDWSSRNTLNI